MEFKIRNLSSAVDISINTVISYAIKAGETYLDNVGSVGIMQSTIATDNRHNFSCLYGIFKCLEDCVILDEKDDASIIEGIKILEKLHKEVHSHDY